MSVVWSDTTKNARNHEWYFIGRDKKGLRVFKCEKCGILGTEFVPRGPYLRIRRKTKDERLFTCLS